jgi:sugar/nucleoside kinase (ribokinase family)
VLSAGFVCGDLVLKPVDRLPPANGCLFVEQADLTIGGCAANAAVAFARLLRPGQGVSAVAGRVGDDALGGLLRQALAAEGVDTAHLLSTPAAATSINTALISGVGERSFFVFPGACDHLIPDDLPDAMLGDYQHLHLAAIGAMSGLAGEAVAEVARRARALGLTVSLDASLNPPRDTAADIGPALEHLDFFLPNLAEAQAVLGDAGVDELLDRGLARGVGLVGIKLGEQGCALATFRERLQMPAFRVTPVDTCGAGDSWAAAVVYAWWQGWPLDDIARFANAAGALCALALGATAGLAEPEVIWRFVRSV